MRLTIFDCHLKFNHINIQDSVCFDGQPHILMTPGTKAHESDARIRFMWLGSRGVISVFDTFDPASFLLDYSKDQEQYQQQNQHQNKDESGNRTALTYLVVTNIIVFFKQHSGYNTKHRQEERQNHI